MVGKLFLFVLVGAVFLVGCTHTQQVGFEEGEEANALRMLNEKGARHTARVTLTDQQRAFVDDLQVRRDTTTWTSSQQGFTAVPTYQVERVRFLHRSSGALEGAAFGALLGTLGGFGYVLFSGKIDENGLGAFKLIPIGAAVGMVVGLIRGHRVNYIIPPLPPPPVVTPVETTPPVVAPAIIAEEVVQDDPDPVPVDTVVVAETLPEEPPPPDTSAVVVPPPVAAVVVPAGLDRAAGGWTLVVASFSTRSGAETIRDEYAEALKTDKVPVDIYASTANGTIRYRVVVGQYASSAEVLSMKRRLTNRVPGDAWPLRIER